MGKEQLCIKGFGDTGGVWNLVECELAACPYLLLKRQSDRARGSGSKLENRNSHKVPETTLLPSRQSNTGTMAQRGCGISILRNFGSISIWAGKSAVQPGLIGPALSKVVTKVASRDLFQHEWFCVLWVSGCYYWTRWRWGIRWGTQERCLWNSWSESRSAMEWSDGLSTTPRKKAWERVSVLWPGEEKAPWRLYSSLPVPKKGLQESWRGTFYMGIYRRRGKGFKLREGRLRLD